MQDFVREVSEKQNNSCNYHSCSPQLTGMLSYDMNKYVIVLCFANIKMFYLCWFRGQMLNALISGLSRK
jgi:hypothetical protein